jgi:hypothetical protein
VRDSTNTLRSDLNLTFLDGYVAVFIDTAASSPVGPVELALGAIQEDWHPPSATWTAAIDTVGDQRLWTDAGAGPVTLVRGG